MHMTFVHGWGSGPDIWDDLRDRLPDGTQNFVDLGFFGGPQQDHGAPAQPSIYITHSLGTMWALKHRAAYMKALVAINGFPCFKPFAPREALQCMKDNLADNPVRQVGTFRRRCGLPPVGSEEALNVKVLKTGLDWLKSWDARADLERLFCPVLVLTGACDPILPLDVMKEAWKGFDMTVHQDGGHALPVQQAPWCADHIRHFTHEL